MEGYQKRNYKGIINAETFELVQALINKNARAAQDQTEYEGRYQEMMERYEERNEKFLALTEQIEKAKAADKIIGHFIDLLRNMNETVTEFDENLWGGMAESKTIRPKKNITVTFKADMKSGFVEKRRDVGFKGISRLFSMGLCCLGKR